MKILVIGAGAVGGFYGALLAKMGAEVSIVARSDYEYVKKQGITIQSDTPLGYYHFQPSSVLRDPSEMESKPDYVLLCTKIVPNLDRVGLLKNALGSTTSIVLICNGVDIEQEVAFAFPQHELISGIAFICVSRTAPGHLWHQAYGRLVLGSYPQGMSEKGKALCTAFERSGIPCMLSEHILSVRWQKCVWNAAFNPLSVLSGGLNTTDILNAEEPFIRSLMEEVLHIAKAVGYPLPPDTIDKQIENTYAMPPYKTSMLLDFEQHRPLETEAILGNAVRAAQREGIAVPHLESVYALLKLCELGATHYTHRVHV